MTWTPDDFRRKVGRYGDRFYVDPLPADAKFDKLADDQAFPSVTAIKNAYPKFLVPWATKASAEFAVKHKAAWETLPEAAAMDLIAKASDRDRDAGGNRGTKLHKVAEAITSGRTPNQLDILGIEDWVKSLRMFLDDWQPEPLLQEIPLIKRGDNGYGGTGDSVDSFSALGNVFVDYKSRKPGKAAEAYDDEGLQLIAYLSADYYIDLNAGVRKELPKIDGAIIVAVSSDGYHVHEVDIDKGRRQWDALVEFWYSRLEKVIKGRLLNPIRKASTEALDEAIALRKAVEPADPFDGLTEPRPATVTPAEAAARTENHLESVGRIVDTEAAVNEAFGAGVETVTDDPRVSFRTWIKASVDFYADLMRNGSGEDAENSRKTLEQLAERWPAGVPTLKESEAHTLEQLQAIALVLDEAARYNNGPFGPSSAPTLAAVPSAPAVPAPWTMPAPGEPLDDMLIDDTDYAAIVELLGKVAADEPAVLEFFQALALDAHAAGYPFDVKSCRSTRREAIYWALIGFARAFGPDRTALAKVLGAMHGTYFDTLQVPKVVGALSTREARRLAGIAHEKRTSSAA